MGKYEQDARLLLEYVGGKENIAAVSHCVSRMGYILKVYLDEEDSKQE